MITNARIMVLVLALTFGNSSAEADLVLINFNDGTLGDPVATFYDFQGVTFLNGQWSDSSTHTGSSPPLGIFSQNTPFGSVIPPTAPLIGVFDQSLTDVAIVALDVGEAGARIEAYDATTGGNLLGFDEFFGVGAGVGNFGQLSVIASGIRRIELFQPNGGGGSGDGVNFDDLSFTVVPEPSSASLCLIAMGVVVSTGSLRGKRRIFAIY